VRGEKISAVLGGGVQALLAQRCGPRHGRCVAGKTRDTVSKRDQANSRRMTQSNSVRSYQVAAPSDTRTKLFGPYAVSANAVA
jgi:hypothetical protein